MSKKIYVDKKFIENIINTKGKDHFRSMVRKNILICLDRESDEMTSKILQEDSPPKKED